MVSENKDKVLVQAWVPVFMRLWDISEREVGVGLSHPRILGIRRSDIRKKSSTGHTAGMRA